MAKRCIINRLAPLRCFAAWRRAEAKMRAGAIAISLILALAGAARAEPQATSGGFVARLEALALIETLNGELLASRSATATLEKWCADHRLAADPKIVATPAQGAQKPPAPETLRRLGVERAEAVKYRHVELSCGAHVLSRADNWYAPERLAPEMNRALETSETPFGKVIAPLQPWRRTIEAKILAAPLSAGWEMRRDAAEAGDYEPPPDIIEHRALVLAGDGRPLAEVVETYSGEALRFAPAPWSGTGR
jgi:hypothetical protein